MEECRKVEKDQCATANPGKCEYYERPAIKSCDEITTQQCGYQTDRCVTDGTKCRG